jgi:hypothetical protein
LNRLKLVAILAAIPLAFGLGAATASDRELHMPLGPFVAQGTTIACDTDGVSLEFTYGASRKDAIKVTGVTVSDIASSCSAVRVKFLDGDKVVDSADGVVVNGVATMSPNNVWTKEFTDVRVVVLP